MSVTRQPDDTARANDVTSPSGIAVGGQFVPAGSRRHVELECAKLPAQAHLALPLEVLVGPRPQPNNQHHPCVWLSAAIHGDEINGMEIITRVLAQLEPEKINGVVLAAPIVNVFGFAFQSRYLPDRRDLNRSFPGSAKGSLAARLARLFFTEVVERCSHGIDLHTGSNQRTNLPQIRTDLDDPEAVRMARAFAAPVMLHGHAPAGSLRKAASRKGKAIIVYEAGENARFDSHAIDLGVEGVLRVLAELDVIPPRSATDELTEPGNRAPTPSSAGLGPNLAVRKRSWVRAPISGIFGLEVAMGDLVKRGGILGNIHQPLVSAGQKHQKPRLVRSPHDGFVIGHTNNPLAYQGDALIHLARATDQTRPEAPVPSGGD